MAMYTDEQFKQLREDYQSSRPWSQKNPGKATAAGLGAGALSGLLGGLFGGGGLFGKKERVQQNPLFSPEIMNLKNRMGPEIYSQLMGNNFDFGPIEQLSRQNFQSKTMPSIMERFNFAGNRGSGGLNAALTSAGTDLDSQLAAMRQNYNLKRQGLLASLMGPALSPSFENVGRPRQAGGMEQGMDAMVKMLPYILSAI